MPRSLANSTMLLASLLLTGCGSEGERCLPVSGKIITKGGRPCDNALIVFHPQDESRVNAQNRSR
jgi:hypothetical protein